MSDLFKTSTQSLLSRAFLSDVRGSVDALFSAFYSDPSHLKTYLRSNAILTTATSRYLSGFLSFNQIPLALYLQKILIEVKAETQKQLTKVKGGKELVGHVTEVLRKKMNGAREEYANEEVKELVYYLWSLLRGSLADADSVVIDQLLLLTFEQF
eukprot:TRINITY_DN8216_c0_g2_i2.p1 TRINITY_DN8216_c0_g2~~TRINITY_DN8216_c0_g2_i2.p1  ORF type:complete len:155 (-),score=35.50 TRINITY_DN8216_c0_g2_i2:51-515(-)